MYWYKACEYKPIEKSIWNCSSKKNVESKFEKNKSDWKIQFIICHRNNLNHK